MSKNKYPLPAPHARQVTVLMAILFLALGAFFGYNVYRLSKDQESLIPEVGVRMSQITHSRFFLWLGIVLAIIALWSLISILRPRKSPYVTATVLNQKLYMRPIDLARYVSGQMSDETSHAVTTVSKKKVSVKLDTIQTVVEKPDEDFLQQAQDVIQELSLPVTVTVTVDRKE